MTLMTEPTTRRASTADWVEVATEVADRVASRAGDHDRSGTFVADAFDELRTSGLLTAPIPAELGGGGTSHAEACEVLRVLGRACGATAVSLSMHYHLVCTQVWRYRHDLPGEAVLRKVADGDLVLISTGASDWLDSSGTATRVGGGFRVSARKAPASGCPSGDVAVTSIHWAHGPDGPQVIHASIPFSADGVSIDETWDSLGLRATGSHTLVFEDVFVADAAVSLIRPAGAWHPVWNAVLGTALPLIMSAYLGILDRASEVALEFARAKADAPHVAPLVGALGNQRAIAEDAVAAMVRRADDLAFANDDEAATFALTRKTVAAEAIQRAVGTAIEVAGGTGYSRSCSLERLYRDVMGAAFHPLPEAKQVRFTGRMALGLDPAG